MADDKKKAPAPAAASTPFSKDHHKEVIYFLLPGLFILSMLLSRFMTFLENLQYSGATSLGGAIVLYLEHLWKIWKPIAGLLSIGAAILGVYSFLKLKEIKKEDEKIFGHTPEDTFLEMTPKQKPENPRWSKVIAHANSINPAEWRLAIIEADIMLDELLKTLQYDGEGVGEMLKKVEPSDMLTLDKAWEAHKVRNRIAHAGQDFNLDERETRRVVALFEEVFKEFQII